MIFGGIAGWRDRLQARDSLSRRGASMIGLNRMGKGRGGKERDTGGGRASLPLSHGADGGEGAASALRRGEWRRRILGSPGRRGGVAAELARTIEGIVPVVAKVLCLLIWNSELSSAETGKGDVCSG